MPSGERAEPLPTEPAEPARRRLLRLVTLAAGAVVGALAGLPGLAFLAHPLRRRTITGGDAPVPVARAEDVKVEAPLRVDVIADRRDAWMRQEKVRLGACWLTRGPGGVRAFSSV